MSSAATPPESDLGSEAARDAVAAIVEKADERQREKSENEAAHVAEGPKKPFLARPAVAGTLMVLFMAILAFDVYLLTRPVEEPSADEVGSMARMETVAVAFQLDAYKAEHGDYPNSLAEAGVEFESVEYTKTSQGYELRSIDDASVTLRADEDPENLFDSLDPAGGTE